MRPFPTTTLALAAVVILTGAVPASGGEVANNWAKIGPGPAWKNGAALVPAGKGSLLYFGGRPKKGLNYVQALEIATAKWSPHSQSAGSRAGVVPLYRATFDARTGRVYCLSQLRMASGGHFLADAELHSYDPASKTWKSHGGDPLLSEMDWHVMALDSKRNRLVVVGASKKPENIGWSRTVFYDIAAGKWSALPLPAADVVKQHRQRVAAKEALIDLIGRTRGAWYRDPAGVGTAAELASLAKRYDKLALMPGMAGFKAELARYKGLVAARKTLDALKVARATQLKIETRAEARYPVPPSRQNSPLVYDAKNDVCVLFGGDHQDYHTNDTWVLDAQKGWRRASPKKAPGPRAGHAMVYLPKSGKVLLYGGYEQESTNGYCNNARDSWEPISPKQMWLYDAGANRWSLLKSWKPGSTGNPDASGLWYSYHAKYCPVPLVALGDDSVLLAGKTGTWRMNVDAARVDSAGTARLGVAPNLRKNREGKFLASYCEAPDAPPDTGLDRLPVNRFVKLPKPPRNVCMGNRNRVWSTATWDADRDQILVWGGGHCVRSENPPLHYSPVSGRMVEGYDAQEAYTFGGAFGTTTMNRPWVAGHSWNFYTYDPKSRMMLVQWGQLYDPDRMDWLRTRPIKPPFATGQGVFLENSPHGAVAWARVKRRSRNSGLWLFDRKKGWSELVKPGNAVPSPLTDEAGLVYDSKRGRMLLMQTPWNKPGDGTLHAFGFKDRKITKVTPANLELGRIVKGREQAYVEHADWVLFGYAYPDMKTRAKKYVRAYDCAGNRWLLLDIAGFPTGYYQSQGWMYDAKRKLVYVVNSQDWGVWALKLDPKTVRKLTEVPK